MNHLTQIVCRTACRTAYMILLAVSQAAWAQPHQGGPAGQGGAGGGRNVEERRAERQQQRREQFERSQPSGGQQGDQQTNQQGGQQGQRMSPDERRALREQIRNHGRDIYRDPAKR